MSIDSFTHSYREAGHDIDSLFTFPYKCKVCGEYQINLSEDLSYGSGKMRKCKPKEEEAHPQLKAMHDNEERRYRDQIGEQAWQFLQEIESDYGNRIAICAARLLDKCINPNVKPNSLPTVAQWKSIKAAQNIKPHDWRSPA